MGEHADERPDVKVLDMKRSELRERFDDLYRVLNPHAVAEVRRDKIAKLTPPALERTLSRCDYCPSSRRSARWIEN